MVSAPTLSIVIPTYQRGSIVCTTITQLYAQSDRAEQIIIVDQTNYSPDDESYLWLQAQHQLGAISLIEREEPSIPAAMNAGLRHADSEYVLFLDDDIKVNHDFIECHRDSLHSKNSLGKSPIVAQVGQVLQPNEAPANVVSKERTGRGIYQDLDFKFYSTHAAQLENCMAGNLCVHRETTINAGGFDENFKGAAYRFETEFARRLCRYTNQKVHYEPSARINHLQLKSGGTRSHASHLSSISPAHSAGDYYFSFLEARGLQRLYYQIHRFLFSFKAKYYLTRPWFAPIRALAELRGYFAARSLWRRGPALMEEAIPLPRLAVLMSHPTQHFAPVYRALGEKGELQLKVFFVSETGLKSYRDIGFNQEIKWDIPLDEGYTYKVLTPGKTLKSFSFSEMDYAQINGVLSIFQPDVIWLHGYGQKVNWRVALQRPNGARIIYTSDSNIDDQRTWYKEFPKQLLVRLFLRRCDWFIATSQRNKDYLMHYGADEAKIVSAHFPIDIERWQKLNARILPEQVSQTRTALGVSTGATMFLFVGKLEKHKGTRDAVTAFAEAGFDDDVLVIIGSGTETANLNQQIRSLNLKQRVILLGFKNQNELADYFAAADVLLFPSHREPYGTIAAEVLPFGLPIIAASGIGAVGSAIIENENAILYPAGDTKALANGMRTMKSLKLRESYSLASKNMAAAHDKSMFGEKISDLCSFKL